MVCAGTGVVVRLQNNVLWRETLSIFRGQHNLIGLSTDINAVGFWVCFVHNVAGVEEPHDLASRYTVAGRHAVTGRLTVTVSRAMHLNPGRTRKRTVLIASCVWRNRNRERLPRE